MDAIGTAAEIRNGEVSAQEVVDRAIERIEEGNGALNAVVATRFEEAREEVARGLPAGPLHGVPILVKDLNTDVAGLPATSGSRLFADVRAVRDSEVVARYRRAGMVVLGSTNSPEFGLNASTEPVLHGPARNPWRPTHSPGGSSGGSAAAVAAGLVPVAHATDGGGSIRIPAAMCGLFGLKPSRGRVPAWPSPIAFAAPFSVHHALTTTVRDSALLLDVAAGPVRGDLIGVPAQDRPFLEEVDQPPGRLRIGLVTTVAGTSLHPTNAATLERAAATCRDLGHEVIEVALPHDQARFQAAWSVLSTARLVGVVDRRLARLGRDLRDDDLEPFTRVLVDAARTRTGSQVVEALETAQEVSWQLGAVFADLDVLLLPVVTQPPPPLGVLDTTRPETVYAHVGAYARCTSLANLTGQPAMSVPCGPDDTGLPTSVQFVAELGGEALLLRLAAQLEEAAPWPHHAPGLAPGQRTP